MSKLTSSWFLLILPINKITKKAIQKSLHSQKYNKKITPLIKKIKITFSLMKQSQSSSLSVTTSNKFFKQNAIKPLPITRSPSYSYQLPQSTTSVQLASYVSMRDRDEDGRGIGRSGSLKKSFSNTKNKNSVHHPQNTLLNPKQFQHRQVFNTKLYKTHGPNNNSQSLGMKKYFQIEIAPLSTKRNINIKDTNLYLKKDDVEEVDKDRGGVERQLEFFQEMKLEMEEKGFFGNEELRKFWKNSMHHFQVLAHYLRKMEDKSPILQSLNSAVQSLQQVLLTLSNMLSKHIHNQTQYTLNLQSLHRNPPPSNPSHPSHSLNPHPPTTNPTTTHTSQFKKYDQLTQIKHLKQTQNKLDFELKKSTLRIQNLTQELQKKNKELQKINKQNKQIMKQKQRMNQIKEDYQYKIKKLKEQLEVAHIVKEQNLEDKYNYILGWKM